MTFGRAVSAIFALLVVFGSLLVVPGHAQAQTNGMGLVADIALRDGGTLLGQVVDTQGVPKAKVHVSVQDVLNREVATADTNEQGFFAISGMRGGVHQIVTPYGRGTYRLWAPGMAPPSAKQGTLIVVGNETVRGLPSNAGPVKFLLSNPLVVGGAVATAIAVPVALHQNHRPATP